MKPRVQKNPEVSAPKSRTTFANRGTRPVKEKGESSVAEAAENATRASRRAAAPKPPLSKPSKEEISARAHAIWEREGKPNGREIEHWLRAEAELRMEKGFSS